MSEVAAISTAQLKELEATVREGQATFLAVGNALSAIRRTRGYRLRGFDTFEEYCQETFGFTARHGRRIIAAAKVADTVRLITGKPPKTEGAVRRYLSTVREGQKPVRAPAHPRKHDTCPGCGRSPSRWVRDANQKYFRCGLCRAEVLLTVTRVRLRPGYCGRCEIRFGGFNTQVPGKPYCAICAEEMGEIAKP